MELVFILAAGAVTFAIVGVVMFIRARKMRKLAKEYEFLDETPFGEISTEEEPAEGCPEDIKKRLKRTQQELFKEAHKIYLIINNMFKDKPLPPEVKKELATFVRSYNRLKEMEEEIEVYPFADCEKVFQLKFSFYKRLIDETAKKLMALAKKGQ